RRSDRGADPPSDRSADGCDHRAARRYPRRAPHHAAHRCPETRSTEYEVSARGGVLMVTTAVMGAGSWGTAFSLVLGDAGHEVRLWGRRQELCDEINASHQNPDYLPGVMLGENVVASHDEEWVLRDAEIVVLAVPS